MANILSNSKKYSLLTFDSEQEFEKTVIDNKISLFGSEAIYIDVKKLQGQDNAHARGIPDGYLIDFIDVNHPQLYFIENELVSHDIYSHITEQLARFSTATAVSTNNIRQSLIEYVTKNKQIFEEIELHRAKASFRNFDDLMNFLTMQNNIKIILCIDETTNDLNQALRIFRDPPDIVTLQRYTDKDGSLTYVYEPLHDEIVDFNGQDKKIEYQYDTVVCAAFEDGFKHAYIQNNAWWAIRLSQEAREKLKYIAIYEKWPVGAVNHYAEIDKIEPYKDSGKYIVYLKNKKNIQPIKLDVPYRRGVAPQGPRYITLKKLLSAKKISELWK
ncbi:MAG: hypothetical protein WAV51_04015 [Microgenomates group bacterium]